jgi:UDP-N-acetylglucosamine 1-carboxyvinyltransferase
MSIFRITGGKRLFGSIRVHGSKNSVLPILSASLLNSGKTVIHNCPALSDVEAAMEILRHLGCKAERVGDTVYIDASATVRSDIPDYLMREMRSSVIFLGAILARTGKANLSLPGGCELGPRPIDLHLKALREMGAEIDEDGGNLSCKGEKLKGTRINFSIPSVGATENAMIAASVCDGVTVITNAAREPEIRDLGLFLNALGFNVTGAGTSQVTVEGGKIQSRDIEFTVMPDRIVAATYLACVASAGGEVNVTDLIPSDIVSITDVLAEMGCQLEIGETSVFIKSEGSLKAPSPITTKPYPGFPTDAQPPILAASLKADGNSVFVETIFDNRYRHVEELKLMGADVTVDGRVCMVKGVKKLKGAKMEASDLRAGAALVVAALGAEGTSEIGGVKHIDRGYDGLMEALKSLGADAERID